MTIQLISPAFAEGQPIPARFTCDGQDISPPLKWSGLPEGARALALIADDPDALAGTWVHWVLYNLPATVSELPEGLTAAERLSNGALQGRNDFRRLGYGGPCPPRGRPHRYFFKLYALDAELGLGPGASKPDVVRTMQGHLLAEGQLVGTYQRT